MLTAFETSAAYGQVAVFAKGGKTAFPYWTEDHVAQGFAMREGIVSFLVPDHDGSLWIEIDEVEHHPDVPSSAIRCLEAPLLVQSSGVAFSSLDGEVDILVAPGEKTVRFVLLPGRAVDGNWATNVVQILFGPAGDGRPSILRRDGTLTAEDLLADADVLPEDA